MSDNRMSQGPSDTSTASEAESEAKSLADDVRNKAAQARDTAADAIHTTAVGAKDGVADEISSIGNALRRASDDLRSGSPQERTFGQMASTLADLSDTVRDKDLGEMVDDLSNFARRNPIAFMGGAALLGFAGVRMAKASQRHTTHASDYAAQDASGRQTAGIHQPSVTPGRTTPAGTTTEPRISVPTGDKP